MNIEAKVIEHLNAALSVPVSADVPLRRPEAFVTVERVGGDLTSVVLDHANIAVQSWAPDRYQASGLAEQVDTAMGTLINDEGITRCTRDSIYNWPDAENSMARYQGVYNITFYKED